MMPLRYAVSLMAMIYAGFAVISAVNLVKSTHTPLGLAGSVLVVVCCYALQMLHCNPYTRERRHRYTLSTLVLQAGLCCSLIPLTGHQSGAMWGFLAGAVTVVVGTRTSSLLFGVIEIAVCLISISEHDSLLMTCYTALSTLSIGLISVALSRLGDLVFDLHRRRAETAWVAVSKERVRFTQDLHDLLSYNLSAFTLKGELAHRLIGVNDARASKELTEALTISRRTLADVRAVVDGNRTMFLAKEVALTARVLESAGVEVSVHGDFDDLDPRISSVLAVVLREAVTNLLRHSRARQCRIRLERRATLRGRQLRLTVANDGATGPLSPLDEERHALRWGSGLDNLTDRMEAVDGTLRTETDGDWFRLEAECPVPGKVTGRAGRSPFSPMAFKQCSSRGDESR
jgi:two-component system sensor histidine kinase DesK